MREGHEEERDGQNAEQRIDPDQGDVEAAESETDPEGAERAVSFQENRSLKP